jgi:hypothetical protein
MEILQIKNAKFFMLLAIGIACSLCNQVKLDPEFSGRTGMKKLKISKHKTLLKHTCLCDTVYTIVCVQNKIKQTKH